MSDLPLSVAIVSEDWDVIDLLFHQGNFNIKGFFAKAPVHESIIPYLGDDKCWNPNNPNFQNVKIILAVDNPNLRQELLEHYGDTRVISLISKDSYISRFSEISSGTIVQSGVKISAHVTIGICCKLNINASIHHDVKIGNFCTIAPGSILLGNVSIGNNVYIGAGAVIKQRCRIGNNCIIGAGAVVVKDVEDSLIVKGVPAR